MDITLFVIVGVVCWVLGIHQGKHWEEITSEE
jgi:hypothetical protein